MKLSPNKPFTWASGWKSPIYCDNRKTLSYPAVRTYIRQQFVQAIEHEFGRPDTIAGVATGGIAHGALVAHDMGLPFVYVRSSAKEHGMKNQVEGDIGTGRNVVVVEDLVSTGKSSLMAAAALREEGIEVKGMVSIFTYGFDEAREAFDTAKVKLFSLTNYSILLDRSASQRLHHREGPAAVERMAQEPGDMGKSEG